MPSKSSKSLKKTKNGSNGRGGGNGGGKSNKQTLKTPNSLVLVTITDKNVDSPVTRKIETGNGTRNLRSRDLTKGVGNVENLVKETNKKQKQPSLQVSAKKTIISGNLAKSSPSQIRTRNGSGNGNDSNKNKIAANPNSDIIPLQEQQPPQKQQQVKSLPKESSKKGKKSKSKANSATLTAEIRNPVENKKSQGKTNEQLSVEGPVSATNSPTTSTASSNSVLLIEEDEQDKENANPNVTVPSRSTSTSSSAGIKNFYSKTNDKTSRNDLDVLSPFECAEILTTMKNSITSNKDRSTERRPVLAALVIPKSPASSSSKSYKVPKSPQVQHNNSTLLQSPRRRAYSLSDIEDSASSSSSSELPEILDVGVQNFPQKTPQLCAVSGKGILKSSSPKTNNLENNRKKHPLNDCLSSSPKRRHVEFSDDNNHTRFFHCENMTKKGRVRPVPGSKKDRQQKDERERRRSFSEFINNSNNHPWTVPSQPWNINTSFLPSGQHINRSTLFEFNANLSSASFSKAPESINFDSVVTAKLLMKHLVSTEGRSLCELLLGNEEVMKILLEEMLKRSDFKENIISTIKTKSSFNLLSFVDEIMREEVTDKCTSSMLHASVVGMTPSLPSMPSGFWSKIMETFITTATQASSIMVNHNQNNVNTTTASTSVSESQDSQNFKTALMREYALKIISDDTGALEYITSEIAKNKSPSPS